VIVQGLAEIVVNKHLEIADYYKASQIKILQNPPKKYQILHLLEECHQTLNCIGIVAIEGWT